MAILKFCIVCLMLVLAGCDKTPEQTATEKKIADSEVDTKEVDTKEVDTKVAPPKNEMAITEETGEETYTISSGEGAEVPKDFPADVFIYHPSKVINAMDMPEGSSLGLTTTDDVPTVAETYKREMTARSWSEQTAVKNGAQSMLVYEKAERIANITIAPMDDATQIEVTVTKD